MKVSLNWIKEFTDVRLPVQTLVEKIGGQLGAVEEVIELGKKYEGVIVAKVVSCQKHPNADKLSICLIDDGGKAEAVTRDDSGYVQVVCGAPNVRETLYVAWIPPGVVVPNTFDKAPFTLEAKEIRGIVSNGMIASAHELALSDDHTGIVELEADNAQPGKPLAELLQLDDFIIDIENKMFTRRPDCFGQLGVAREIAGITNQAFTSPAWYLDKPVFKNAGRAHLAVNNALPEQVPRFAAVILDGVKVGPSPLWLQSYLVRVGIRPVNNVVDITNYLMMLTGQPLHAYDADKLRTLSSSEEYISLETRLSKPGDTLTLLGGKVVTFRDDKSILITSNDTPVGIGGVMGGAATEVDDSTTSVVLECATFDMYSIRRTSMQYGLFTEAVTRFTKNQSPMQNAKIVAKAIGLFNELAGAEQASTVIDSAHNLPAPPTIRTTAAFINERLGLTLESHEIARLLQNVEFGVQVEAESLVIMPPFWRTDLHIPEDIVEEVGRLYGYDHLPQALPTRSLKPAVNNDLIALKQRVREILKEAGANEVLTYSFVPASLMEKTGQNPANAYKISNALSPGLQYVRMSLLPSLLEKIHPNVKAGAGEFALFEINQTHGKDYISKEDGLPIEEHRVALVFAADDKTAASNYGGAPYFLVRRYVDHLLNRLGIDPTYVSAKGYVPEMEISKAAIAPFNQDRAALIKDQDGRFIGEIGEFKDSVRRGLKLPAFVAGCELDIKQLLKLAGQASPYVPLSRYPGVEQDICLAVPLDAEYAAVSTFVRGQLQQQSMPTRTSFTLTPIDIYQKADRKQITFRINVASHERTLRTEEVSKLLDTVARAAKLQLGAERI